MVTRSLCFVVPCVKPRLPFFLVPAPSFTPSLRAWRLGPYLLLTLENGFRSKTYFEIYFVFGTQSRSRADSLVKCEICLRKGHYFEFVSHEKQIKAVGRPTRFIVFCFIWGSSRRTALQKAKARGARWGGSLVMSRKAE